MAEFTKGPWRYDSNVLQAVWADRAAGEMMVCQVRGWGHLTGIGALHLPEADAAKMQDACPDGFRAFFGREDERRTEVQDA